MEEGAGRVVVDVVAVEEARVLAEGVSEAYRAAFGAAPNSEGRAEFDHQRGAYARMLGQAGFRLAVARRGGDLVGFAYGVFLASGSRWWEGMVTPLPAGFVRETGARTFALIDMGVVPGWHGRGVGRRLHDAVLGGCGAERATLAVEPRLQRNQRLYRSWGWRRVGRLTGSAGDIADAYDIYVMDLPVEPTGSP